MKTEQPHRKRLRRYHEPGDFHELTFSTYRRLPLLTNDDWRRRLARTIDAAGHEVNVELVAFVIMPEHVHLLVYPLSPTGEIDRYLARLKQPFSAEIHKLLADSPGTLLNRLTVQERPGKKCFRFWQAGAGYDRNLMTPQAIESSLDYIHENPVRRKLCRRATEWRWSSARYYMNQPPRQQEEESR